MATSVYANPQERHLDSKNISIALDELKRELRFGGRVTCNLSSSGLTLDCVRGLPDQLRSLSANVRLYALDLSLNRITANWEELLPIVRDFLGTKTVEYLDLSLNYLPALETLQQSDVLLRGYVSYGDRLSLGVDGNFLTGDQEYDRWILGARKFKREAYGYSSGDGWLQVDLVYSGSVPAQQNLKGTPDQLHANKLEHESAALHSLVKSHPEGKTYFKEANGGLYF
ncbi:MAG: hypothetical protein FRX49_02287 [Trebouxia sp. A1-2]|nr:MAG: hypothetical protein FRX49_02287 [Trebouxia sp. A1-2]